MARRCLCDRLRQRIATDPRLVTLPMAAKWLWLSLAERAAEHPGGVLPLGSPPFGFLAGIAMLIQAAETEIETQWETLVARGLALRDGDAVVIPGLEAAPGRSAAARANGGLGGRPRKGETPETARLRRAQTAMLLPVEGGAAKPSETQAEKPPTTSSNSESTGSGRAGNPAREVSHSALGAELAELAGLDPIRQRFDYAPVREWIQAGITPATLRRAFARVVERDTYVAGHIRTLRYFDKAVHEAHAEVPQSGSGASGAGFPMIPAATILAWVENGCDPSCRPVLAA